MHRRMMAPEPDSLHGRLVSSRGRSVELRRRRLSVAALVTAGMLAVSCVRSPYEGGATTADSANGIDAESVRPNDAVPLPLKHQPRATTAAITAADLLTRVYIFADDSMRGRLAGTEGNFRGTRYIAAELARLGVPPAGESGTYFQNVPLSGFALPPGGPGFPPEWARNVIAVIPGSDPALRGQFIALGAHNDHIGVAGNAVDHDSSRIVAMLRAEAGGGRLGASAQSALAARARQLIDSMHKVRPPRLDSVNNGADDDGSGSMTLLELAEYFQSLPATQRPRRSILFVWHTAEEGGLVGSELFTARPTVPRDSIVAQVNIDMVGRGRAEDVPGGGPGYLAVVGARRLSSRLGDVLDSVNAAAPARDRFAFDLSWDAVGHPEMIYCRSDHYNYARWGIPVAFLFTGLHIDYHERTDEPQYLDYSKLERVGKFVASAVAALGNSATKPLVDKPYLGPNAPCM